jgi:hypothetical protein
MACNSRVFEIEKPARAADGPLKMTSSGSALSKRVEWEDHKAWQERDGILERFGPTCRRFDKYANASKMKSVAFLAGSTSVAALYRSGPSSA